MILANGRGQVVDSVGRAMETAYVKDSARFELIHRTGEFHGPVGQHAAAEGL